MTPADWLILLKQQRVIAVIRAPSFSAGLHMATAVAQGGIRLIEIAWNSERPADLVLQLRRRLSTCWIGAGTLLSLEDAEAALSVGAAFGFSPRTQPALLTWARERQFPMVTGALTPTEILTAWEQGASGIKVFPISAMGGANYLKSLREPLGPLPLIPTGGVTLENSADMLQSGAIAVGLSSALFPNQLVNVQDWSGMTQRTQQLLRSLPQQ